MIAHVVAAKIMGEKYDFICEMPVIPLLYCMIRPLNNAGKIRFSP